MVMQKHPTTQNPSIKNAFVRLGLIAVMLILIIGCGGGSGSSSETAEPISDEALAFEMMVMARSFNDASDPLFFETDDPFAVIPFTTETATPNDPINLIREKAIQIAHHAREVNLQSTYIEPCESGNIALTEISNGYQVVFNNCQLFDSGITIQINGGFNTVERGVGKGYIYSVYRDFNNLNIIGTSDDSGDTLTLVMDGNINTYYNPDQARRAEAGMRYDMLASCGSQQAQLSMVYTDAVFVVTPDGNGGHAVTMDGRLDYTSDMLNSAPSGRFDLDTREAMRFANQASTKPYDGRLNVTTSGRASATLQYVTGGVFVDGQSYSWGEILRELDDYQTFDNFEDKCNF